MQAITEDYFTTAIYTSEYVPGPAGVPNAPTHTVTGTTVMSFNGTRSVMVNGPSYTKTSTWTNTWGKYSAFTTNWDDPNARVPSCTLPSRYPPCESQWASYIARRAGGDSAQRPSCTQAALDAGQCQTFISQAFSGNPAPFGRSGINAWVTTGTTSSWPTTESFAPNCTLGCQQCAITGDKVRILYWPTQKATVGTNGTALPTSVGPLAQSTTSATAASTIVYDGVTLTSPTVYISYRTLYASDSCSGLGRTISNTIIALSKASDLSSLAYIPTNNYGPRPGMSGLQFRNWAFEERPFNFTDLEEPIPDAVYNQLPHCQMAARGFSFAQLHKTHSFSCERSLPYNPVIAIPTEVMELDESWSTCTGWYAGLYDPPKVIQAASSAATPTAPPQPSTSSAKPIATIADGQPRQTTSPKGLAGDLLVHDPDGGPTSAIRRPDTSSVEPRPHSVEGKLEPEHPSPMGRTSSTKNDKESDQASQGPQAKIVHSTVVATVSGSSGQVVINNATLFEGRTMVVDGDVLLSLGSDNLVYQLSQPSTTSTSSSSKPPTYTISVNDTVIGPKVFTATSVLGSSGVVAINNVTMTPGAPLKTLDSYLMSLGTGGVMYKVPIPHTTKSSSTSPATATVVASATNRATSEADAEQNRAPLPAGLSTAVQALYHMFMVSVGVALYL